MGQKTMRLLVSNVKYGMHIPAAVAVLKFGQQPAPMFPLKVFVIHNNPFCSRFIQQEFYLAVNLCYQGTIVP